MIKQLYQYIDNDVYVEAKERVKYIIDTFDTVCVAFSGGKDSLVMLHLLKEVYNDLGIKEKVKVVFRDEELIPDDVIEFVQSYREKDWIEMLYFATALESEKYILGKKFQYLQWDPNRSWIRNKPDYSISFNRTYSQYDMDVELVNYYPGKIAVLTGIRAQESLTRLRSSVNKKHLNYINSTDDSRVSLCKPLFDWSEDDIFKYFYDKKIKYCTIYDCQNVNGQNLRVSTPLHAESSKRFGQLRTLYPKFYQQLIDMFPEMILQEKYFGELDRKSIYQNYEASWEGIRQYIDENIVEEDLNVLAHKRVTSSMRAYNNKRMLGIEKTGYPPSHIFKQIVNGNFKRVILPIKEK